MMLASQGTGRSRRRIIAERLLLSVAVVFFKFDQFAVVDGFMSPDSILAQKRSPELVWELQAYLDLFS
jgi:hypothetical protein